MNYLKFSEFIDEAPESPGSVRINHDSDDCTGSSKSLKIERKEDGSIHAHCFRCGRSGLHRNKYQRVAQARADTRYTPSSFQTHSTNFPRDGTGDTSSWPAYARNWIKQWGITNEEIRENLICYSPHYDRLCFRVEFKGSYAGYCSRAVNPTDNRPKWLRFTDGNPWFKQHRDQDERSVLVLVEDIVSAIKVFRVADACALLTTSINTSTMSDIAGYDRYVIWLDDDNRQVKMKQLQMHRRLSILGDVSVIHETDPKRCTDALIQERIYGV